MLLQHYIPYVQLSKCNANMMLEKNEYETFQNINNMNIIENRYNNRVCNHIITTLYHLQLKVHIQYNHNINAISLQYRHNVNTTCQTTTKQMQIRCYIIYYLNNTKIKSLQSKLFQCLFYMNEALNLGHLEKYCDSI
jgi:hypothetical protein